VDVTMTLGLPRTRATAGQELLRVLFVQDHLARPGEGTHGVTRYLATTLAALPRVGIAPMLLVLSGRRGLGDSDLDPPPRFLERGKWDPRAFIDLLGVIREVRPHLLHLGAVKAMLLGRVAGRLTGVATVVHLHDALPMDAAVAPLQRRLARWTDAAVAVSAAIREVGVMHHGLPPERIEVLHNGVALDRFAHGARRRAGVRARLGIDPAVPVVIVVGRLAHGKGQDRLLACLPAVRARLPAVRLLVVGDGPERTALERRSQELGLGGTVTFLGYRDDVPDLLAAADLAVVPSLVAEGLGLTAIEGLCAGLPVIACRSGGLAEVVTDGVSGRLVTAGDVAALGAAILEVLTDPGIRDRLAAGARREAMRFSVEHHVERLRALYDRVLAARRADAGEGSAVQ
jgi:glycosyltransferase involved in cell wall biosynthesis